jgi:hypothetical protein
MKVSAKLAKAFAKYNANAKAHQVKPISEARLPLFAMLETLAKEVPSTLKEFADTSDRSTATARYRSCVEAYENNAQWVTLVDVFDYCETRSANPRYENTLREAINSYYLLGVNARSFCVVPDRANGQRAYVVRTK